MADSKAGAKNALVYCVGSPNFVPEEVAKKADTREKTLCLLKQNDFERAIKTWFSIPEDDKYVYHAITSVRLDQVQQVVALGGRNGLHAWYRDEAGKPLPPPSPADIEAYVSIFLPHTATVAALNSFTANAKKGSIRQAVAARIRSKRFVNPAHPLAATLQALPRVKKQAAAPPNPYLDFWVWSCHALEWCGPTEDESEYRVKNSSDGPDGDSSNSSSSNSSSSSSSSSTGRSGIRINSNTSHHVLPVLMHHFGCAVPSHEALSALRAVAAGRTIADVGSGGGYWTFALRQYGVPAVPVDSMQSAWRTTWVADTVVSDGAKWLARREVAGAPDMVLLLVYPIVGGGMAGGTEGGFTRGVMEAYRGDTVAVAGTQNHNGYTGFRDMTMDEYMAREKPGWVKIMQIPLPSFAGKDEALYIFQVKK